MSEYDDIIDGSTYFLDTVDEFLQLACCDCGMVHNIYFVVDDNELDKVHITTHRNNRSTGQMRRHNNGSLQDKNNKSKWRLVRNAD